MFSAATQYGQLFPDNNRPQAQLARRNATGPAALWQADVGPLGYSWSPTKTEPSSIFRFTPVCFSANGTLLVSFVRHLPVPILTRGRVLGADSPLQLVLASFDSANGKLIRTNTVPVPDPRAGVFCTSGGNTIILTSQSITFRDVNFKETGRIPIPPLSHPTWSPLKVATSPTGNSLLMKYLDESALAANPRPIDRWEYEWIDLAQSRVVAIWQGDLLPMTISDQGLIGSRLLRGSSASLVTLYPPETKGIGKVLFRGQVHGSPFAVSETTIGFERVHGLTLTTTTGEKLFSTDFAGADWLSYISPPPTPSSNGKSLAITIVQHKGEIPLLDTDFTVVPKRILVLDIPAKKWVFALDTKRRKTISGLALSPDGTRMAILADGVVELYQLSGGKSAPWRRGDKDAIQ